MSASGLSIAKRRDMMGPLVLAQNLERVFRFGSQEIRAIHDVNLEVQRGQFVAITGRSGAGKTTLLNLIAGLDRPTSGAVYIEGEDISRLSEDELTKLRRHRVGFVFQSFGLLPLLSAYENVELPLRIAGVSAGERERRAHECLELVGLGGRANHRPYELSGGEQQRVAIARALVNQPALILADEPTGELDSATASVIFSLLREIVDSEKVTFIAATHDPAIIELASLVRELSDGTFIASPS
jgi:putative ABC transport system ATP-binding protein